MNGTNGDTEEEDASLSLDTVLDVLSHRHRREILRALRDAPDNACSVDELIGRLQEQEERAGEQPSLTHLSATLHHVHEPKLREIDVLSYDDGEEVYRYHPTERLEKWLDHIDSVHESEM